MVLNYKNDKYLRNATKLMGKRLSGLTHIVEAAISLSWPCGLAIII